MEYLDDAILSKAKYADAEFYCSGDGTYSASTQDEKVIACERITELITLNLININYQLRLDLQTEYQKRNSFEAIEGDVELLYQKTSFYSADCEENSTCSLYPITKMKVKFFRGDGINEETGKPYKTVFAYGNEATINLYINKEEFEKLKDTVRTSTNLAVDIIIDLDAIYASYDSDHIILLESAKPWPIANIVTATLTEKCGPEIITNDNAFSNKAKYNRYYKPQPSADTSYLESLKKLTQNVYRLVSVQNGFLFIIVLISIWQLL